MAPSSAKSASNVMPTRRKGSEISHTNGHKMSASNASGQQSNSKMSQPMNASTAVLCRFSDGHE
jgi:hypothetical protein